jgi:hypothetical protein
VTICLSTSQIPYIFHHYSVQLFSELDKVMQIWTLQTIAAGLPLTDIIL